MRLVPVGRPFALVGVGLGGLERLRALLEFGGFFVAAELAESFGFRREVANEERAVGTELFFGHGDNARVAGRRFVGLAPLVVDGAEATQSDTHVRVLLAVVVFVNM